MDSRTNFPRLVVVARRPLVRRPMDPCRRQELDAQLLPRRDVVHLLIEAPSPDKRLGSFDLIPLNRLRRHVENAPLGQLRMEPHEGSSAAGGTVVKGFALRSIRLVPAQLGRKGNRLEVFYGGTYQL